MRISVRSSPGSRVSFGLAAVLAILLFSQIGAAAAAQIIALKAARLFDGKSKTLLQNGVVIVQGNKIVDLGSNRSILRVVTPRVTSDSRSSAFSRILAVARTSVGKTGARRRTFCGITACRLKAQALQRRVGEK